jgi:hypothetical protein
MAKLLRFNGVEIDVKPKDMIDGFTLTELRRVVGDPLQLFLIDTEWTLVVNPARSKARINQKATELVLRALIVRHAAAPIEIIRGDVLLAKFSELQMRQILKEDVLIW